MQQAVSTSSQSLVRLAYNYLFSTCTQNCLLSVSWLVCKLLPLLGSSLSVSMGAGKVAQMAIQAAAGATGAAVAATTAAAAAATLAVAAATLVAAGTAALRLWHKSQHRFRLSMGPRLLRRAPMHQVRGPNDEPLASCKQTA